MSTYSALTPHKTGHASSGLGCLSIHLVSDAVTYGRGCSLHSGETCICSHFLKKDVEVAVHGDCSHSTMEKVTEVAISLCGETYFSSHSSVETIVEVANQCSMEKISAPQRLQSTHCGETL